LLRRPPPEVPTAETLSASDWGHSLFKNRLNPPEVGVSRFLNGA